MFRKLIIIIFPAIVSAAAATAGNSILYDSDQLSSSLTSVICQDRYGYIWIGTEYGLNKFDGYRFTQYLSHPTDSTTISNNEITTLFVDSEGQLWVGMSKGLARYDYKNNNFIRYPFESQYKPRVTTIMENGDTLFIGTSGYGVYTLAKGETMPQHDSPFGHRNVDDFCTQLFADRRGHIWRSSHLHLITKYTKAKDGSYSHEDFQLYDKGPAVSFIDNGKDDFWIVCMYGILKYNYATNTVSDAGIDLGMLNRTASMRTARHDRHGNLLIGTSGAGMMMVPHGRQTLIPASTDMNDALCNNTNVNDILCDKEGGVWLSCYGKGVCRTGGGNFVFESWTFTKNNIELGSRITSTAWCHGAIWCTVQFGGLYRFGDNGYGLQAMNCPKGTNLVYCDSKGQMWICTENALYSYSPDGTYQLKAQVNGMGINTMTDDGRGRLYISDFGRGLFIYDTVTGKNTSYSMNDRLDNERGHVLHNDWIKSLLMLDNDILMIGTMEGLQAFNTSTGKFGPIQMSGTPCTAIQKLNNSQLIVGTTSGLYTYGLSTAIVRPLNNAVPLQDKNICAIRKDKRGNLWISTASGIWAQSYKDKKWHGYIRGNGLVSKEYIAGASVSLPDGRIGFATADGITLFRPADVSKMNERVYPPRLSNIIIGGHTVSPLESSYTVPYDENTFSLEYSTMAYHDTDNVTYEYRINGNGNWESFGEGHNVLSFNRMPPGTYKIEVRTRNDSNISDSINTVTVRVSHPWYSSPLAYAIYSVLLIMAAAFGVMYYRRRKRAELDEAKMQFLINATHDIRSPLTLILGPLAKLREVVTDEKQTGYLDIIERNAQRLLLLVNQILDERKIDKNQMHLHCTKCDIAQFTSNICSLYQYRADEKNIKLIFSGDTTPVEAWIDRIQFDKVVNNLISNAFKYTAENGNISVSVKNGEKGVVLTVTDNGIGIDNENREKLFERFYQGRNSGKAHIQGTGIGLNLSRAIVEMHGGKISAANRDDGVQGACFTVTLPYGHHHLKPEYIENGNVETVAVTAKKPQPSQNVSVLVVDDNTDLTQYISNEIGGYCRISVCADGLEALNTLHRNEFDLVVSDVMMPRMDGIELLRNIKQTPKLSHIPVIMLTSKSEIEDRLEGLRRGADAYMAKPFNIEELKAQIANLIDNNRRLKGKYSGQLHTDDDAVSTPEVKGNDEALMEQILTVINKNLSDSDFNVETLATEICISRAQLHRKMKEITGISTSEYIRNLRMEHASRLIKEGKINITQIAYAVGFNNQAHFSTVFKKHFGMSPTEYAEREREQKNI